MNGTKIYNRQNEVVKLHSAQYVLLVDLLGDPPFGIYSHPSISAFNFLKVRYFGQSNTTLRSH